MGSFKKEVVDKIIEDDEEIIDKVLNPRKVGSLSTHVYLTEKRIIYHKQGFLYQLVGIGDNYRTVNLDSVEDISYLPKPMHSGGLLEVYTKDGSKKNMTPSYVGEKEAQRFAETVRDNL